MPASDPRRPARRPPLAALLVALALGLAACDSAEPERVGVTGQWAGNLTYTADPSQVFPTTLTLADTRSNVTGSGVVTTPQAPLPFTVVSGLYQAPNLYLQLNFSRPPQGALSGIVSVDRDSINGTLSGPNLANGRVVLTLRRVS